VLHQTGGVFDPYYLTIARSTTTATTVALWAKVFRKPAADSKAPTTSFEKAPPSLVGPFPLRLIAVGADDQTPVDLLRYEWRVDGGAWSEGSFARDRQLQLDGGQHQVEARAVDLNGNADAKPASAALAVDALAPKLQLTEAPPEKLAADKATLAWTVSDDYAAVDAIEVKLIVKHEDPQTGKSTAFIDGGFVAGALSQELKGLTNGKYTASLVARDQVGNVSAPVQASFAVEGQKDGAPGPQTGALADGAGGNEVSVAGGCACRVGVTPGGSSVEAALGLLALALLLHARRRRA
jgi:MYXO-CTERM domain-containing protein